MAKKEIIYQGLDSLNVDIEEFGNLSPDYLRITTIPDELVSGTNILKFKGNPELFVELTPVYIEILDSNGEPVYYETGLDLESGQQTAIVSIFVNEDTAPGNAIINICGTLKKDSNGRTLDTSKVNLRWAYPIYIDPTKRNSSEIIFSSLPEVSIFPGASTYTNFGYPGGSQVSSSIVSNLEYYYYNDTPVLITGSNTVGAFNTLALDSTVYIDFSNLSNIYPSSPGTVSVESFTSSISSIESPGIAILKDPLIFDLTGFGYYQLDSAAVASVKMNYVQSASLPPATTENSFNLATAYFSNIRPQVGSVSKIRSYYRSAGVGEYILSNETDITSLEPEFGFTPETVTASFAIPTLHRNDRIDFKFEFVNPYGSVSKQFVESLNNLFLGGNTYIGGDDNLITGSLYVAGATGTGIHISGKGSSAMMRSIGYTGFDNAVSGAGAAGFVIFSGSIQPILGSSETYSGVGLELVANANSYFRYYTKNGGLLDIRTDSFFIGNSNTFLSGSNNNLEILNRDPVPPLTKFHLRPNGQVTASSFVAFTGSSDTNNYLMMDTSIGLIDGKNIGRPIWVQSSSLEIASTISTSTIQFGLASFGAALRSGSMEDPYLDWQPVEINIPIYILPFENSISIYGNAWVEKTTAGGILDHPIAVGVRTTLWAPNTSSYSSFGMTGSYHAGVSGSLQDYPLINLDIGYTISTGQLSGYTSKSTPFRGTFTFPNTTGDRLALLNIEYCFFKDVTYGNTDFDFRAKLSNIYVSIGRRLQVTSTSGKGDVYTAGGATSTA